MVVSSDQQAFLSTIADYPDEETPRLMFADWLEESGDPRAELIRIQCILARGVPEVDERLELLAIESRLVEAYRRSLPDLLVPIRDCIFVDRGLLDLELTEDALAFVQRTPKVLEALAGLGVAALSVRGAILQPTLLHRLNDLPHLRRLTMHGVGLRAADLATFFASPTFERLHSLNLNGNPLGIEELRRLPNWPFPNLRHFSLDDYRLGTVPPEGAAWRADHLPTPSGREGTEFRNSIHMRFRLIPAGTFFMGSPETELGRDRDEPLHRVRLSRPFYISETQVTQQQFEQVMGRNPAHFHRENGGSPLHPVEQTTWDDAVAFCARLSDLPAERSAGRVYRLPTEAEWEYAARGGTQTAFTFGDTLALGWANVTSWVGRTTPVASYRPNRYGLYDVHGNVREWCADWYDREYYHESPGIDPPGPDRPTSTDGRLLRGGSWDVASLSSVRCAYRVYLAPPSRTIGVGFRVVCTIADHARRPSVPT